MAFCGLILQRHYYSANRLKFPRGQTCVLDGMFLLSHHKMMNREP